MDAQKLIYTISHFNIIIRYRCIICIHIQLYMHLKDDSQSYPFFFSKRDKSLKIIIILKFIIIIKAIFISLTFVKVKHLIYVKNYFHF